ncbi:MAG: EAL domain-containing protein [Acidobacteria bacterium]|nr:EAL domain-containing protein [Acidobacteriota bacterium]
MTFDKEQANPPAARPAADATLEALRQAEAQYRSIFENSLHGIYQSTPDGRFLNVNAAFARMLGYDSPAELVSNYRSIEQDYYADPSIRATLRRTLEEGGAVRGFECQARRRDGALIWTRENFYAVRDSAGRLLYFEGSVEDITEHKEAEIALAESEARYRRLFADANDIVYTTDLEGNYTSINRAGESLTGYTRDEIVRMNYRQIAARDQVARADEMLARKLSGAETTTCYETEIVTKSGERRSLEVSTQLIRARDGAPVGVQGIARDITERRQSQRALEASEAELRALFAAMTDVILVLDRDGRYLKIAPTNPALLYKPPAELLGKTLHETFPADEADFFLAHVRRALDAREPLNLEYHLDVGGAEHWFAGTVSPMLADAVIWVARDITERKRAEEKLLHIAFHDSLTNLPNRALFTDHLRLAVEAAKRRPANLFAVLFLDLDRFKVINDSLGHTLGDELLVALARRLESTLRAGDTVARLGGDEFAILLNALDRPGDALHIADRIQQQIMEPFRVCGQEVFTTASIGIALSTTGYTNEEDVLRDADTVMYRAKARGAARYEVFDQVMHARVVSQLKLENDLRRAVERKEFALYYQPIVSLGSGRVTGFEALVRWRHPERGLVSPAEFIPIAEETGLIVPLGLWVLEAACRQMREWHRLSPQNRGLKLSVNLSGRQFWQADLLECVTRVLEETDFDPRCLQLEITESVVMENARAIVALMDELRALGIELAIDDFGTGYSSLSYLQRFPIHTLKIDRSFISPHGAEERENSEIVRTIILLARNMGKEVVAEGVETAEQYARLRELECDYGQGYLFSRPQDARATEELLRDGRLAGLTLAPADGVQAA